MQTNKSISQLHHLRFQEKRKEKLCFWTCLPQFQWHEHVEILQTWNLKTLSNVFVHSWIWTLSVKRKAVCFAPTVRRVVRTNSPAAQPRTETLDGGREHFLWKAAVNLLQPLFFPSWMKFPMLHRSRLWRIQEVERSLWICLLCLQTPYRHSSIPDAHFGHKQAINWNI